MVYAPQSTIWAKMIGALRQRGHYYLIVRPLNVEGHKLKFDYYNYYIHYLSLYGACIVDKSK